jgi:arylsulfatase A-like enzyme
MNVILVMSDTFRQDNLKCYNPKSDIQTPCLDKFASESHVFDNALLGSFPTVPNRLDIMSGKFGFIDKEWAPLPKETITLQEILTASGYTTQMIIDNPHLLEMGFNYDRGFSGWEWIRGHETDKWKTTPKHVDTPPDNGKTRTAHFLEGYLRNTAWWTKEADRFAPRTVNAACDWLEEAQDLDKFFLYIDLFDPHEPWDAPQKYIDMYEEAYDGEDIIYPNYGFWKDFLSEKELKHIHALYKAETTMVDQWIGKLLNKIEELGMDEDTAVIFTSDHGYLFGEHGLSGKSLLPKVDDTVYYEAAPMYKNIRDVPLMIRMPGQKEQKRHQALVQSPDLMPTILEMAGLVSTQSFGGKSEIQSLQCGVFYTENWKFEPDSLHGKSILPVMNGEQETLRNIAVSSNTMIHHSPILARCSIVTADGWCLLYSGDYGDEKTEGTVATLPLVSPDGAQVTSAPALFYLPDDPNEENNLIDEKREIAEKIHAEYYQWLKEVQTPETHLKGRKNLGGTQ